MKIVHKVHKRKAQKQKIKKLNIKYKKICMTNQEHGDSLSKDGVEKVERRGSRDHEEVTDE